MNTIEKIYRHLKLVHNHRKLVFKLCCKAGIPIQGLMHDLSKYTISELKESIDAIMGNCSISTLRLIGKELDECQGELWDAPTFILAHWIELEIAKKTKTSVRKI